MMLNDLIQILILSLLIFVLGFYLQANPKNKKWIERVKQTECIFWLLIGWIILGFFTHHEYNQLWGCVIRSEPIFSTQNILYSTISLVLLLIGYFIPNSKISIAFLVVELLFWGIKLFFIKGGYAVGFGGGAVASILLFDIISLSLRFVLIKRISSLTFNSFYVFIPVLVIMVARVIFV